MNTPDYVIYIYVSGTKLGAPEGVNVPSVDGFLREFQYGAPSSQPVTTPRLVEEVIDALSFETVGVAKAVAVLLRDYYENNTSAVAEVKVKRCHVAFELVDVK